MLLSCKAYDIPSQCTKLSIIRYIVFGVDCRCEWDELWMRIQTVRVSWSVVRGRSAALSGPVRGSVSLSWLTTWRQVNAHSLTSHRWSRRLYVPSSRCWLPSYMTTGWPSTSCMSSPSISWTFSMMAVEKERALVIAARPVRNRKQVSVSRWTKSPPRPRLGPAWYWYLLTVGVLLLRRCYCNTYIHTYIHSSYL